MFGKVYWEDRVSVTFMTLKVWCEHEGEIEFQCYGDAWVTLMGCLGSGSQARARVRIRLLVRCTGKIGLLLQLRSVCDVRVRASLSFSFVLLWVTLMVMVRGTI